MVKITCAVADSSQGIGLSSLLRSFTSAVLASIAGFYFAAQAGAADIALTVANPESSAKTSEPVTSGVPFAEGALASSANARMLKDGTEIPAQFLTTARWPDGSVRWLLCDFQTDLPASGSASLTLQTGTAAQPVTGVVVDDQASTLTVDTGAASFSFDKSSLVVQGNSITAEYSGQTYTATPYGASAWVVEENGPMKAVVRVDGDWRRSGALLRDAYIGFRLRLFFYRNKSELRASFTFRNNNSFGWDNEQNKQPDLIIGGLSFGTAALLPSGSSYVFGSGVEKTFDTVVLNTGTASVRNVRYNGNGTVGSGFSADRPLALASPEYYSSTKAWGRISAPLSGLEAARQADFDRFEKLHRAMVSAADLENPPNNTGITAFQHLYQDIASWNDYGDLRWGGDAGHWSGNHYDWSFGFYLHLMRTGNVGFANLARVMARHEMDMDVYHSIRDGNAYNRMKVWESRPSHDNPGNSFGPGRPTHNWCQGYALHWLITGDPRGRDCFEEILDGLRLYIWESFNAHGNCNTNEIRLQGWITENLVALWRINPDAEWTTSGDGNKNIRDTIKAVLQNVFEREAAAGQHGYVYAGDPDNPDSNTRHPLQNCYFIEPAAYAYEEIFNGRDTEYAASLLALIRRMTDFLMSNPDVTHGGDSNGSGMYRPLQIYEYIDPPDNVEGQIPYLLMASNGAGFCYLNGGGVNYLNYMRAAFQDYIRYYGSASPESYVDPALRTPTCYNSNIYQDTESKVQGWANRYGMFILAVERQLLDSHTVNFIAGNGGSISGTSTQIVAHGGNCTDVSAVPDSGFSFSDWTSSLGDSSTSNPITVTNVTADQTWTANFTVPPGTYSIFAGAVIGVPSSSVGIGEDYNKKPGVRGTYAAPTKGGSLQRAGLTIVNSFPSPTALARWGKTIRLYDSRQVGIPKSGWIAANLPDDLELTSVEVKSSQTLPPKTWTAAAGLRITYRNPRITGISGTETAGTQVTVRGQYFGEKAPRVLVEYQTADGAWKYKSCRIDKILTFIYSNAKGKPAKSCTKILDSDTVAGSIGDSILVFEYPSLPEGAAQSHYIIMDNGAGMNCRSF